MSLSIKHLRNQKEAQSSKLRRMGAAGSLRMARKGEHAPRKYASGGPVDSGPVDGAPSKPRLDRPGRKMAGKDKGKKGGTNVNVIVMPKGSDGPPPMPGAGAGPPAMPPHPMPMPPPGAGPGGPPMPPMRKHGGAVGKYATGGRIANLGKFAHGGKVKRADGGWTGEGDSGKAKKEESAELSKKSSAAASDAKGDAGGAAMSAGARLAMAGPGPAGKIYKGLKLANTLFAGNGALLAASNAAKSSRLNKEAGEASKAGDEAEGHKRGGSVKR